MKKMLFVMNPYAGQRKGAANLAAMIEIFNRADYAVTVHMTAGSGDAEQVVQTRGGEFDVVACCGGDGTFNETVSGLLKAGLQIPVGYIPAGSTNDFATSLGLSLDNLQAARDIVAGHTRLVDVGVFGERYFTYVASFGAFTRASYATPQSLKNVLGHAAYLLGGLAEIGQVKEENVTVELEDGTRIEGPFFFGAVSNSTSVGGVLSLSADRVDMADGMLEVLLARSPKNVNEVGEMLTAFQNKTYNCTMLTFLSTKKLKVIAEEGMAWTIDGEHQDGIKTIDVTCHQHALQMLCPAKREALP